MLAIKSGFVAYAMALVACAVDVPEDDLQPDPAATELSPQAKTVGHWKLLYDNEICWEVLNAPCSSILGSPYQCRPGTVAGGTCTRGAMCEQYLSGVAFNEFRCY